MTRMTSLPLVVRFDLPSEVVHLTLRVCVLRLTPSRPMVERHLTFALVVVVA
jgi:hypothetical protein